MLLEDEAGNKWGILMLNELVSFGEGVGVDQTAGFQMRPQKKPARVSPPRINYPHIKTLVKSDPFPPHPSA